MGNGTSPARLPLFSLRLPAATKSRWREAAREAGCTLAGYIKHAVDQFPALSRHVWYCEKCDRWQDHRSGCEVDARFDQREMDACRIESAGCVCHFLVPSYLEIDLETGHDRRCPHTLAAGIRGVGGLP